MLKFLKVVFLIFVVLILAAGIGLTIFLATFDISRYKPAITQELSRLIGRTVDTAELRLDFKMDKGLTIEAKELSISDDPAFAAGAFVRVKSIYFNVDLPALISRRQIVVAAVDVLEPRVSLIRNPEGVWNAQTLSQKTSSANQPTAAVQARSAPTAAAGSSITPQVKHRAKELVLPQMLIQTVRIRNGTLTLTDATLPLTASLQQINFEATALSLQRSFPFELTALLWADQPNIKVHGEMSVDLENSQVQLDRVSAQTDLSQLRLRMMPFYALLKEELLLEEDLEGKLAVRNLAMRLGPQGLIALSLDSEFSGGRASSRLLPQPLEDIHMRIHADASDIDVEEVSFSFASGTVTGRGRVSGYGKSNMLLADVRVEGVQLQDLIPPDKMPVLDNSGKPLAVEGGVYATTDAEGHGADVAALRQTLQGDGALEVHGGKLNVNLLRLVLDKLSFIPDLAQRIEENLPPQYKKEIQSGETVFTRIAANVKLKDQALSFDTELHSDVFALSARGNLNWTQDILLMADFYIPAELAQGIVAGVNELSYLQDPDGKVHIPFKPYQGKLQDIRIYPDVGDLAQKIFENKGKEELRKAIFKALDIEETPPAPEQNQSSPTGQENPPEQQASPEKILIEGIFDAIFNEQQ